MPHKRLRKPRRVTFTLESTKCAHLGFHPTTLLRRRITKDVGRSVVIQSVAQERKNQEIETQNNRRLPTRFICESMRVQNLHATTGLVNCAFHIAGGQWLGNTSPRPTLTHLLAARAPDHEDGVCDHDALRERSDRKGGTRTYKLQRSLLTCESQRDTLTC